MNPEIKAVYQEIQSRTKEVWRLVRKPLGYLVAGGSSLALACATQPTPEQAQKPQEPKIPEGAIVIQVTNTPTPVQELPTATATATPKPEPTNTPEPALKLADNDVYAGSANRVNILFIVVPDNTAVFQVRADHILCSDDRRKPLAWLSKFPRTASGFDHQRPIQNELHQFATGRILDDQTVAVTVGNEKYSITDTQGKQITCSENSFKISAKRTGHGEKDFKNDLAKLLKLGVLPPELDSVVNRYIGK